MDAVVATMLLVHNIQVIALDGRQRHSATAARRPGRALVVTCFRVQRRRIVRDPERSDPKDQEHDEAFKHGMPAGGNRHKVLTEQEAETDQAPNIEQPPGWPSLALHLDRRCHAACRA